MVIPATPKPLAFLRLNLRDRAVPERFPEEEHDRRDDYRADGKGVNCRNTVSRHIRFRGARHPCSSRYLLCTVIGKTHKQDNLMAELKHGSRPIVVEETAGRKAYCQCGWSEKLPYCDGSHGRLATGVVPIVHAVDVPGRKSVCQCHRSASLPWCDGSHKTPPGPISPTS